MSTLNVNNIDKESGSTLNIGGSGTTVNVSNMVPDVALSNRNLIINGAMNVAQRGTSEIGTANYLLDRWKKQSATNANVTFSQDSADTPDGFRYAFKALATGSSTFIQLGQPIEFKNMAHAVGKTVTLSYWAKTNLSFYSRIRSRTDTEDGVTVFTATTLSVITESPSADWKLFTHTFTVPSATLAMSVDFNTGALVSGDYFSITGVQLEVGSVATPFEHESYGQTLAKCQRYYQKSWYTNKTTQDGMTIFNGTTDGAGYSYQSVNLHNVMRTQPTITMYETDNGTSGYWNANNSSAGTTDKAVTAFIRSTHNFSIQINIGGSWLGAQMYGHWEADAEL